MTERVTFYEAINGWRMMPFHELEERYKLALRTHHPDAHVGRPEDVVRAHELLYVLATEAWSVLGTRLRRSAYDKLCYTLGRECPECNGKGFKKFRINKQGVLVPSASATATPMICPCCKGTGYKLAAKTWPELEAL